MAESVRKWSTGSLEEKKDTKKITQKKEPQWMTNLLRSKDVSKARLPTLWQQCLYGLLIALNRVQCPFSLLMSISKLPRKASSTFLSDIIFHDFFFPTKWHAWCLFSFQNCKNCVGWNARTQWLHHFFFSTHNGTNYLGFLIQGEHFFFLRGFIWQMQKKVCRVSDGPARTLCLWAFTHDIKKLWS